MIFQPVSNNFNKLVFSFDRTIKDIIQLYQKAKNTGSNPANEDYVLIDSASIQLAIINNFLQDVKDAVKIGIQGTPGTLMCINGEGIRIGPSGIYEIKNGYKINNLTPLPKGNQKGFIDALIASSSS